MIGKVRNWNAERGFGFVSCDDPDEISVFCHVTAVQRAGADSLIIGEHIEFDVAVNPRNGKNMAVNLKLLSRERETV
jgi:cold shock CspA family protein